MFTKIAPRHEIDSGNAEESGATTLLSQDFRVPDMANPGLLPSPCGEGSGGRCPAARGLVPVVGFAGAPVEGASVIQQLSCYGVLADSHLTSPRSTQSSGPPPLPCTTRLGLAPAVVTELLSARSGER